MPPKDNPKPRRLHRVLHRDVLLAPFHLADVRGMDPRPFRQLFLGQSQGLPSIPEAQGDDVDNGIHWINLLCQRSGGSLPL